MVKQEEIQEEDTKEEDINNSKHTVEHSKQTHMLVTTRSVHTYTYTYGGLMNSRDKLLKILHRPVLVLLLVLLLHRDQKLGLSMPLTGLHTDTTLMILNVSSVFVFEARDKLTISPSMAGYAVWSAGRDSCCFIDHVKG
jgi:hypothetical protein